MSSNLNKAPDIRERFAEVFSRLPEQDIEQFYAHYQLWVLHHRVPILEKQIETLREHIAENQRSLQSLQPPSIALAVLVRLQSNGVNDINLLDQMLERGENWLDKMMQRLDYCEQVEDFILGDYTQWCVNSLEGAYDWIDTLRGNQREETPRELNEEEVTNGELTEELLLQKLSFDEDAPPVTTLIQEEQPDTSLTEETETLDQPVAESMPASSAERTMLALFLNQDEETEQTTATIENASNPPWYSVPLENDEDLELDQVNWITILQADTVARIENGTTEATEHNLAEIAESDKASATVPEAISIDTEMAIPSADAETSPVNTTEHTVAEQNEQPGATLDETQPAWHNANTVADAELVETREIDLIPSEEPGQSESEIAATAAEIEPVIPEAVISEEQETGIAEDTIVEIIENEESYALLTADTQTTEIVTEEKIEEFTSEEVSTTEPGNETTSEETASISTEITDTSNSDEIPGPGEAYSEIASSTESEVVVTNDDSADDQTIIADASEQLIDEAFEPVSNDEIAGETPLDEPIAINDEETDVVIADIANSETGEAIVSAELAETSISPEPDETISDEARANVIINPTSPDEEPALQEQISEFSATTSVDAVPAIEDEKLAWYEYLERDPEIHGTLKQEWQVASGAQPTAAIWENQQDDAIADDQTQPMSLYTIKQAGMAQAGEETDLVPHIEAENVSEPLSVPSEVEQTAEETTPQEGPEIVETTLQHPEVQTAEKTMPAEPASLPQTTNVQEPTRKPGFWRRLFGKK